MITGFNTDIEHGGVTYHVQTEDKGLESPLILSLVYVGGAIIASKRSRYSDLIESGYDEGVLTERLQRQHKLICAAIRAGRVEDLKRMGEPPPRMAEAEAEATAAKSKKSKKADAGERAAAPEETLPAPAVNAVDPNLVTEMAPAAAEHVEVLEATPVEDAIEVTPLEEGEGEPLYLSLLEEEGEFRAGQLATIKVRVGRGAYGQRAAHDASVTIKVLGTSFRPLILSTRTDHDGVAVVRALLPRFTSGRAAIIIRATSGAEAAEMRRIIHQY